ncbi:MAG TPA: hypothetical protein VHO70_15590 [Chitinispirillaceae bacterium]|nr:hypothetical protein [Chitinispirillaceae bacterium]
MNHTTIKFALIVIIIISFNRLGISENAQKYEVLNNNINAITGFNDTIFAGTPRGLFVSFNNGTQWNLCDFSGKEVSALEFDGKNLYAAVEYFIYHSTDKGKTWSKIETSQSLQPCLYILSLLKHQNILFVGLDDCNPFFIKENDTTMKVITYKDEYVTGFQFLSMDTLLFIASGALFRSVDMGYTLEEITPSTSGDTVTYFNNLTKSGNAIFTSCNKGIFRSTDSGSSWINCTPVEFSSSFNRYNSPLATSGNVLFAALSSSGIIRSTDNGNTWLKSDSGLSGYVTVITAIGVSVFAATNSDGIFRSNDSGRTWQCVNMGLPLKTAPLKNHTVTDQVTIHSFHYSTSISVTLAQTQTMDADILDIKGRKVASLVHARLPGGSHQFTWNNSRNKSGCYIVRLRIGETVYTKEVLKIQYQEIWGRTSPNCK